MTTTVRETSPPEKACSWHWCLVLDSVVFVVKKLTVLKRRMKKSGQQFHDPQPRNLQLLHQYLSTKVSPCKNRMSHTWKQFNSVAQCRRNVD